MFFIFKKKEKFERTSDTLPLSYLKGSNTEGNTLLEAVSATVLDSCSIMEGKAIGFKLDGKNILLPVPLMVSQNLKVYKSQDKEQYLYSDGETFIGPDFILSKRSRVGYYLNHTTKNYYEVLKLKSSSNAGKFIFGSSRSQILDELILQVDASRISLEYDIYGTNTFDYIGNIKLKSVKTETVEKGKSPKELISALISSRRNLIKIVEKKELKKAKRLISESEEEEKRPGKRKISLITPYVALLAGLGANFIINFFVAQHLLGLAKWLSFALGLAAQIATIFSIYSIDIYRKKKKDNRH